MSEKDIPSETLSENTEAVGVTPAASVSTTDVTPAASSPASTDVKKDTAAASPAEGTDVKPEKPVSMFDKVKQILGVDKPAPAEPSKAESKPQEKDAADKTAEEKPAEDPAKKPEEKQSDTAEVPKEFAKHPAWQRILKERDSFKTQATQYQNMEKFLTENNIPGHDAAEALKITALVYNNPQEALKRLDAFRKQLAVQIGLELPDDLKKDVDDGFISEDRAKELSLTRNKVAVAEAKVTHTNEEITQTRNERNYQERAQIFDAWNETTGKTDPDLQKKLPLMQGELLKIRASEGEAQTADDARSRLDRAHKEVTAQLRSLMPRKAAVTPSPQATGQSSVVTKAPSTMLEAVQNTLNKRRV